MARANGVSLAFIVALYICATLGAGGAIFEIQNKCPYTVWAAGFPGGGTRLESGQMWTLPVANGTERGRLWGRTGCFFDSSGEGGCNTGNCGSPLYCEEPASPPVTVVEYSLNQSNNLDFYDISLVEGFNLPMSIIPSNSSCQAIACSSDINAVCPAELKVVNGCYSACTTFNTPQYCCTGEYSNNCSPTNYSKFFKDQCPQAYSYAMDDATSTFNCSGGNNYKVVFCGGNVTSLQAPPGSTNSAVTPLSGNSTPPSGVELPDNCKKPSKIVPILVGSVVGTALFVILCLVFGRCVRHRKSSVRTDNNLDARENFGQVSFDYKVLRDSTDNFDRKNMLGKGGFGEVYKGILPDGRVLAVKKLNGRQTTQAAEEFLREVRLILSVRHRNLVRLLGCCKRGHKRLLVYEFMSNSSLDKHLFGEIRNALSWENRLNIIVGTARGLAYLHGESNVRIIHRDIKCANILLDDKLHPKIADFGLARFFPESQTHVSTRIGGTIYGIVVLEIVSGRKCVDARLPASLQLLLEWAWNKFEQNQVLDIVDPLLEGQYRREQALRVITIALLCTQGSWTQRPAMSQVLSMLTDNPESTVQPTRPAFIDAAADRPENFTPIHESATSAAAPPPGSHGSISVSFLPR